MKILIVDDERDVETLFRQRFRKELRTGQIDLQFAFSGEEALAYLEKQAAADVVLILSDINMPGMHGIELLRRIKSEYGHLKVFMITAYGDDRNLEQARQYGCDDYLVKPLDFQTLKDRIFAAGE